MMGGYAGGMGLGWIWPVILVLGVVVLVWGLVRARSAGDRRAGSGGGTGAGLWTRGRESSAEAPSRADEPGGGTGGGPGAARAREILRERYARGEITADELRERMRVLDER